MKAFSTYLRPRSDTRGGGLSRSHNYRGREWGDSTPNTSSSRKTILIYRKKGNLTLSCLSSFVTWLGRLKHGALGEKKQDWNPLYSKRTV